MHDQFVTFKPKNETFRRAHWTIQVDTGIVTIKRHVRPHITDVMDTTGGRIRDIAHAKRAIEHYLHHDGRVSFRSAIASTIRNPFVTYNVTPADLESKIQSFIDNDDQKPNNYARLHSSKFALEMLPNLVAWFDYAHNDAGTIDVAFDKVRDIETQDSHVENPHHDIAIKHLNRFLA